MDRRAPRRHPQPPRPRTPAPRDPTRARRPRPPGHPRHRLDPLLAPRRASQTVRAPPPHRAAATAARRAVNRRRDPPPNRRRQRPSDTPCRVPSPGTWPRHRRSAPQRLDPPPRTPRHQDSTDTASRTTPRRSIRNHHRLCRATRRHQRHGWLRRAHWPTSTAVRSAAAEAARHSHHNATLFCLAIGCRTMPWRRGSRPRHRERRSLRQPRLVASSFPRQMSRWHPAKANPQAAAFLVREPAGGESLVRADGGGHTERSLTVRLS